MVLSIRMQTRRPNLRVPDKGTRQMVCRWYSWTCIGCRQRQVPSFLASRIYDISLSWFKILDRNCNHHRNMFEYLRRLCFVEAERLHRHIKSFLSGLSSSSCRKNGVDWDGVGKFLLNSFEIPVGRLAIPFHLLSPLPPSLGIEFDPLALGFALSRDD